MNFKDKLDFGGKRAAGCRRPSENMVSDGLCIVCRIPLSDRVGYFQRVLLVPHQLGDAFLRQRNQFAQFV